MTVTDELPPTCIASFTELRQYLGAYTAGMRDPAARAGVYFLCLGNEVVYVGQATKVGARVGAHFDKEFDRVYYISCRESELTDYEGAFIYHLKPKLNRTTCGRARGKYFEKEFTRIGELIAFAGPQPVELAPEA